MRIVLIRTPAGLTRHFAPGEMVFARRLEQTGERDGRNIDYIYKDGRLCVSFLIRIRYADYAPHNDMAAPGEMVFARRLKQTAEQRP